MQHVRQLPSIHHVFSYGEKILSWVAALLVSVTAYSLFIKLFIYFMELLYEIFVRYQY